MAMYSISSFVKKLGRSKSKIKYSYNRLVEAEDAKGAIPSRRGYIAMYVGEEAKRYEVPIKFLSSPTFQELLMQSQEDDLESKISGPIMIGCTSKTFEHILKGVKSH